jgi:hypothetical protein
MKSARPTRHHLAAAIIGAICSCITIAGCGTGTDDPHQTSQSVFGDLTGDDTVDVVDLQCMNLVQRWVADGSQGAVPACLRTKAGADLNCDGAINVVDYQLAAQIVTGKPLSAQLDSDGNGVVDACEPTYGDLTGDGEVNVADLTCMSLTLQWAMQSGQGTKPICLSTTTAADLNCDGQIGITDLLLAINISSGTALSVAIDSNGNGIHDQCE